MTRRFRDRLTPMWLAGLLTVTGPGASAAGPADARSRDTPLDADACVRRALDDSPEVAAATARTAMYAARLAEVEALYGPRLGALAFVAPTFTVEGSGADRTVERRYGVQDWGPYTRLEATLALPIYSFGRFESASRAAEARRDVEAARADVTRAAVALAVRRLYWQRAYALGLTPTLTQAAEQLETARRRAEAQFAEGGGAVSNVDLARLEIARLELERAHRQAVSGAAVATEALAHTMGLDPTTPPSLDAERLTPPPVPAPPLHEALARAARDRPEFRALDRGAVAARTLAEVEGDAWLPVLGAAATFQAGWAPTRDDSPNPYHADPYNEVQGGAGLGLLWHFSPFETTARADAARAQGDEVEALRRFAATGIPIEVRVAHRALADAMADAADGERRTAAARRWLASAARAYDLGSGDAETLLEGLAAYVLAKKAHADALLAARLAEAELARATGAANTSPSLPAPASSAPQPPPAEATAPGPERPALAP